MFLSLMMTSDLDFNSYKNVKLTFLENPNVILSLTRNEGMVSLLQGNSHKEGSLFPYYELVSM
jgi:hypothetical protein